MAKAKILVVEDEAITAKDLQDRLRGLGYDAPAIAASGEGAIKKAEEIKPDLILMDIILKGDMDGIEAAEQIRDRFDIPVVYVTAYIDEERLKKTKITEPYGYIIKPFEDKELRPVIEMALDRHKLEKALRESEGRFRTIVETAPCLLIITDAEGNNIYVSPNCEVITGYTQEELRGERIWWVHEDDTPMAKELFEHTFREGVGDKNFEYKAVKKNGELWYASSSWEPLKDEKGKFKGIVFQTIDISERKRAEEALRASENEKKSILNAISDVVVFQDKSLSIRWVNDAAARSVGKTPQELVGCHCYELWHGQSEPCEGCPVFRAQETGSSAGGIMTTPDGKWWEITAEPVRDIDEKIVGAMEIGRDITERKRAEENLKQLTLTLQEHVEKLEESKKEITKAYSLREHFLKETSHRIITPVSIIGGYIDLLLENTNLDAEQKEKIRIIRERNEEIQKLVQDALAGKSLEEGDG